MTAVLKNLGIRAFNRRISFKASVSSNIQSVKMSGALNEVPDVDIDGHGKFKYILINIVDEATNATKPIVRGYARAQWHSDIFNDVEAKIQPDSGLKLKCVGGGRIQHDPDEKTIKVYGYSQGYGKADHEVSVGLLKKKYPDYTITWSDEGY